MCFASLFYIIITQQINSFFSNLNLLPGPPLSSHECSERRKTGHISHNQISLTVLLGVLRGWMNYKIVHCSHQVEKTFTDSSNPQLDNSEFVLLPCDVEIAVSFFRILNV